MHWKKKSNRLLKRDKVRKKMNKRIHKKKMKTRINKHLSIELFSKINL